MTRCVEWYDKFERDGNFCGLSAAGVSQVKAYNEMREKIGKHIPDRAFVVDNFPEGAARKLSSVKDDETRTLCLNFVIETLKKKEKVTAPVLQKKIQDWLKPDSCTVEKKGGNLGHVSKNLTNVKSPSEEKPKKPGYVGCYQPGELNTTDAPPQPSLAQQQANKEAAAEPAPAKPLIPACTRGGTCPKMKTDGIRGKVCDMLGVPINQLPASGCPFDAPKGFAPASRLDAAKPLVERPAYKIVPVQLSKQEAEAAIKSVVRGYLTKAQQGIWEDIRRSGECGESDLEIFQGLIDKAGAA